MSKVVIKSLSGENNWTNRIEETKVYVDGVLIGTGDYGGEPEDNCRGRDYYWVEPLLRELALKLGAEVTIETGEVQTEDEEEDD